MGRRAPGQIDERKKRITETCTNAGVEGSFGFETTGVFLAVAPHLGSQSGPKVPAPRLLPCERLPIVGSENTFADDTESKSRRRNYS
jgi:hypothetical protein